jgi:hypothetical protein
MRYEETRLDTKIAHVLSARYWGRLREKQLLSVAIKGRSTRTSLNRHGNLHRYGCCRNCNSKKNQGLIIRIGRLR